MPREQAQHTRQKKGGSNPGTFSPDDDEAQDADVTRAGEQQQGDRQQGQQGDQRQARDEGDRRRRPEENIEQVEDEEAEDDEDESGDTTTRS